MRCSKAPYVASVVTVACLLALAPDAGLSTVVQTPKRISARALPALPVPTTNNAVAAAMVDGKSYLYSFLGLGAKKEFSSIHRECFRLDLATNAWERLPDVPTANGRLASTAQTVDGKIYLFGGYTVAENGDERSLPDVDVLDARTNTFSKAAPMPVPVDDAISVVWRDRFIILVSGWSDTDNVRDVQIFDTKTNRWAKTTPLPGPGLFGHAGAIVGDQIVIADGVKVVPPSEKGGRRSFSITGDCYIGRIRKGAHIRIDWRRIKAHPLSPRYRMAAGAIPGSTKILFTGGTENPYNYNGIGYNGVASTPAAYSITYDVRADRWDVIDGAPLTMDHRGLVSDGKRMYLIGGMNAQRDVVTSCWAFDISAAPKMSGRR